MIRATRAALAAALPVVLSGALSAALPATAVACTLVLDDHRTARELARVPLDASAPSLRVAFTHSVLGTPVEDRYVFRRAADGWRAVLVEERWQGEGYGLPIAAAPGETLQRDGDGWRLLLQREVHPLVIRAVPAQRMRVIVERSDAVPLDMPLAVPLDSLGARSIALRVEHCAAGR